jgi:UDP-2-acetamido-2-deoxy-ribo-hexuluronate aminotransferase
MDSLQCAVVLANLARFDEDIALRQAVARRYHDLLEAALADRGQRDDPETAQDSQEGQVALRPFEAPYRLLRWPAPDRTSVFAQYSLLARDRDALQATLRAEGIPTAVHYPMPMNQQPAYAHYCCPECTPVAAAVSRHIVSLPMHPHLGDNEQQRVVRALRA